VILRPHGLHATVIGNTIKITASMPCRENCKPVGKPAANECSEVCPKCKELHEKHAGKAEMVGGLMKACHLAILTGRFEKAADLARQAHAVDPVRVESDPMVIKLDLLNLYVPQQGYPVPGTTGVSPTGGIEEAEEGADGQSKLVPHLPGIDSRLIEALDVVLRAAESKRPK
jgi:hypothetical protein